MIPVSGREQGGLGCQMAVKGAGEMPTTGGTKYFRQRSKRKNVHAKKKGKSESKSKSRQLDQGYISKGRSPENEEAHDYYTRVTERHITTTTRLHPQLA